MPALRERPCLGISLRERTATRPEDLSVLRGTYLEPTEAAGAVTRASPLVEVYEGVRGLTLVTRDRIGVVSLPARQAGRRVLLRVTVAPSNPTATLEDFIRILLLLEGDLAFGAQPVNAAASDDFVEVVCRALLDAAARLHQRGPCRTYVEEGIEGSRIRGRLDLRHYARSLARGTDRVRSIRHQHTLENRYNWVVSEGLRRAALLVPSDSLRRQCRHVASRFSEREPPFPRPNTPLQYGGQFEGYRFVHSLARVLARHSGGDPALMGESAFLPFTIQPSVLYQRFLTRVVTDAFWPDYRVETRRYYAFEDESGKVLTDRGYLVPDIQIVDVADRRLLMLIDAKYEDSFPGLPSGDFYQAYVYGHLLVRRSRRERLPVVLVAPARALEIVAVRRGNAALDPNPHRPTTWVMGMPLGEVARAVGRQGLASEWRNRIRTALTSVAAA